MERTAAVLKMILMRCRKAVAAAGLLAVLLTAGNSAIGQENGFSENHVKALFLYNFAKYVQWPDEVFSNPGAPITIGIVGDDNFGRNLRDVVQGRTINGRGFAIKHLLATDDPAGCQILFISNSESSHIAQILTNAAAKPVLTVGEDKAFSEDGGIIDFVLKNGNVRLEINLDSADKAGLKISSRLLSVADSVKRKGGHL
jgi:hypothetical protein